jgi:hypothetical protein
MRAKLGPSLYVVPTVVAALRPPLSVRPSPRPSLWCPSPPADPLRVGLFFFPGVRAFSSRAARPARSLLPRDFPSCRPIRSVLADPLRAGPWLLIDLPGRSPLDLPWLIRSVLARGFQSASLLPCRSPLVVLCELTSIYKKNKEKKQKKRKKKLSSAVVTRCLLLLIPLYLWASLRYLVFVRCLRV